MTMPNFLIIGAGKSGTTSLYYYLKQHPEVYMSPVKEPKFFALEGRGVNFTGPGDQETMSRMANNRAITDIEGYRKLFDGVAGEKAVGEASPMYLHSPQAPARIKHYVPDVRLVAVLRNPVERAYSAYLHQVRDGREKIADFARALGEEEARTRAGWAPGWQYRRIGFYHAHLKRYYETFGREKIRVYLYEDMKSDLLGMLRDLFRFLEVEEGFVPDTSLRHNASGVPKSRLLVSLLKQPNPIKDTLKPLLPEGLRKRISVSLQNKNLTEAPPLDEDVRRELTETYRQDILELQGLIRRDLSAWLR